MNLFCNLMVALSRLIDLTDNGFLRHGERVALLAWFLAEECLPEKQAELFYAGLVHDLGAVPAPHHMTEYATYEAQLAEPAIRFHPTVGAQLIRRLSKQHVVADLILEHHEHWDGTGYPNGKKGEQIALGAQVLRIADRFDVLLRHQRQGELPPLAQFFTPDMIDHEFSSDLHREFLRIMGSQNIYQEVCDDTQMTTLFNEVMETKEPLNTVAEPEHLATVLDIFAEVIDSRHSYTSGHSKGVSQYCQELATAMGLSEEMVRDVGYAALLHDAGMVAVPKDVLEAPRKLDDREIRLIKSHPIRTMLIINQIYDLSHLALIAGYHHTRYDGKGYPVGLGEESIPLLSRIMAVCDAFDAMSSPRPYHPMRTAFEAGQVLQENAGTQFDPLVVQAALSIFSSYSCSTRTKVLSGQLSHSG